MEIAEMFILKGRNCTKIALIFFSLSWYWNSLTSPPTNNLSCSEVDEVG